MILGIFQIFCGRSCSVLKIGELKIENVSRLNGKTPESLKSTVILTSPNANGAILTKIKGMSYIVVGLLFFHTQATQAVLNFALCCFTRIHIVI